MSERGAQRSGINRAFSWIKKVLEVTEPTDVPDRVAPLVQPGMDVFGWERLAGPTTHVNAGAAAPASIVTGPLTPQGILRVVFHASVRHTDTGVVHFLWIDKLMPTGGGLIGITSSNVEVPVGVDQGLDRWIFLEPGCRIRGRAGIALVAGAIALDMNFIDLPFGEYIQT